MRRLLVVLALGWLGWWGVPGTAAAAVTCQIDSSTALDYGTPGFPIGPVATPSTVRFSCQGSQASDAGTAVLVCVGIDPTTNPRRMARVGGPGSQRLTHNIYRDPGHTELMGRRTNAFQTLTIGPNGSQVSGALTLYGQLTTPQAPSAGDYREAVTGLWGFLPSTGSDCGAVPEAFPRFTFEARATLAGSCSIRANDLSFGSYFNLNSAVTGATDVVVTCTNGTLYRVSLNGGTGGTIANRRMRLNGVGPKAIGYNLYTDPARTQVWGDEVNGGAVVIGAGMGMGTPITTPVYGLVPADPTATPGLYTDSVTATVEY